MNNIDFELLLYDYFSPQFHESYGVINDVLEMFTEDPDKFQKFIGGLLQMIDVGESPLTGKKYKGFSKDGMFLAKVEIEDKESNQ